MKYLDNEFFKAIPRICIEGNEILHGQPDVSVLVLCYNQAEYIEQALDGIINQKTNFRFEVLVGDDHSTDGTFEIVQAYQRRFPHLVRILTSSENVGAAKNFFRLYQSIRGRYFAYCEGDDFWIDQIKLQKQFDLMQEHHEYAVCFTNSLIQKGSMIEEAKSTKCGVVSNSQFVLGIRIPTCTLFFRKYELRFPAELLEIGFLDRPVVSLSLFHGLLAKLNDCTATYRAHDGGIWSTATKVSRLKAMLRYFRFLRKLGLAPLLCNLLLAYSSLKIFYFSRIKKC